MTRRCAVVDRSKEEQLVASTAFPTALAALLAAAAALTLTIVVVAASKGDDSDVMDETPLLVLPLLPVLMPVREVFRPRVVVVKLPIPPTPKLSLHEAAGDSGTLNTPADDDGAKS